MNPLDLFNQVKEINRNQKDFEAAKTILLSVKIKETAWRILLPSSTVDFWF